MAKFDGKKFRKLMDEHNLSERDVAEHIGYTPALVHFFIVGTRKPNLDQAAGMAQLVNCKVDDLIIEEGTNG